MKKGTWSVRMQLVLVVAGGLTAPSSKPHSPTSLPTKHLCEGPLEKNGVAVIRNLN